VRHADLERLDNRPENSIYVEAETGRFQRSRSLTIRISAPPDRAGQRGRSAIFTNLRRRARGDGQPQLGEAAAGASGKLHDGFM